MAKDRTLSEAVDLIENRASGKRQEIGEAIEQSHIYLVDYGFSDRAIIETLRIVDDEGIHLTNADSISKVCGNKYPNVNVALVKENEIARANDILEIMGLMIFKICFKPLSLFNLRGFYMCCATRKTYKSRFAHSPSSHKSPCR